MTVAAVNGTRVGLGTTVGVAVGGIGVGVVVGTTGVADGGTGVGVLVGTTGVAVGLVCAPPHPANSNTASVKPNICCNRSVESVDPIFELKADRSPRLSRWTVVQRERFSIC